MQFCKLRFHKGGRNKVKRKLSRGLSVAANRQQLVHRRKQGYLKVTHFQQWSENDLPKTLSSRNLLWAKGMFTIKQLP